jgi:hypothetical protein
MLHVKSLMRFVLHVNYETNTLHLNISYASYETCYMQNMSEFEFNECYI